MSAERGLLLFRGTHKNRSPLVSKARMSRAGRRWAITGKPKATFPHKPTFLQRERWKSLQKARRKGVSLRAIERESGIHRATIKRYLYAEGPPARQPRVGPATSTSDTMVSRPGDISAGHLNGHLT